MSGRLPYKKRRKYPHMIAEEAEVWEKFVEKFPGRFDSVDYDFRVGEGQQLQDVFPENYERMIKMLTQHRIDVVGWKKEKPTIVEVKDRAILSTIGQLMGYHTLFVIEFPNLERPDFLCICNTISGDVITVFREMKIPWVVV